MTLVLVTMGPVLALSTFLVLGPFQEGASSPRLRLILLADLVYVLVVAALVFQRVARMVAARRAKSAGSQLHLRLTGVFALLALAPTVLVAVFAALTLNIGLEGWFSERVRQVVGSSLAAAEAYEQEHRRDLEADARALSNFLTASRRTRPFVADGDLRLFLTDGQSQIQRGLKEAYVIDSSGRIRVRGERSYLFDYEEPTAEEIARALDGEVVVLQDWDQNEFRALMVIYGYFDRLLYVSRSVDGDILSLLDETQETVVLYNQLEQERGRVLFEFGLIYLGFALILILAAVWLGMWYAERLSRPVGRLAGAAARVGEGNLDVQVPEESGEDEIAVLGRIFNQMTRQLNAQRETLLQNNRQIEARRRLFDSVLSSVTAGVIGVDENGLVQFVNRSAERLLALDGFKSPAALEKIIPEFSGLFETARARSKETAQEEIVLVRSGKQENLLVRMSTRRSADGRLEGYVVAFDDVTDLVSAQRMAAWGDVARRIAHEIKNPLTPIQLSAERVKRKFSRLVGDEADALEQLTDVIIRQTNDLRRIVDEFSKFARMPEPLRKPCNLTELVRAAVLLQEGSQPNLTFETELPSGELDASLDETMIGQALTNLMKNAGEAIESRRNKSGEPDHGMIRVRLSEHSGSAVVTVSDNGIGLPADRSRLFEPYVTTRDEGTGLGLSIVRKIAEEHGGTLVLEDAEPFDETGHRGAMAILTLPLAQTSETPPEPAKDLVT
jgi:two-component system nitrogen regulation sensor histidine kinase NtrY